MADKKIVDPVEEGKDPEKEIKEAEDVFSIDNLSMEDLHGIPEKVAKAREPFDGYPFENIEIPYTVKKGQMVKNEILKIPSSFIVILNPTVHVHQDPSGYTLRPPIHTYHSRYIVGGDGNAGDYVFDRAMKLKDGQETFYCIVKDNTARSQILFKLNKKKKIEPNRDYLLIDNKQSRRLRECFQNHFYQMLKGEKQATKHETEADKEE